MIHRKIFILFCVLVFTTLTSCFDVVEEIDLKSNGSGTIKATLNVSKSKTKVASLMKLDKIDGFKIPSEAEIRKEINSVVRLLQQTKGIKNVKQQLDFNNYIASVSMDFENAEALNVASKTLSDHFKIKFYSYSSYSYDPKDKTFTRNYNNSPEAKKEFAKLSVESQKSVADASYTSIYRFQDDVQQRQNQLSKVSPNKKAVMLKTPITELISGKVNLSNRITLSK